MCGLQSTAALSRTCSNLQQNTRHSELLETSAPTVSDSCYFTIPEHAHESCIASPSEAAHSAGSPVPCMEVTVGVCGNSTVCVVIKCSLRCCPCVAVLADKKLPGRINSVKGREPAAWRCSFRQALLQLNVDSEEGGNIRSPNLTGALFSYEEDFFSPCLNKQAVLRG